MNFAIQAFQPVGASDGKPNADAGLQKSLSTGSILQDFAKMLITQITNQDPNNPMDPTAIIAQFAQVQSSMGTAKLSEEMNYYFQAKAAMDVVGKTVQLEDPRNPNTKVTGQVQGAEFDGNIPGVIVNGTSYPITWLNGVAA